MNEASKIKHEQHIVNKLESQRKLKDDAFSSESKMVLKKEREAKKLEILEAEVLKRLRDTHLR